MNLVQVLLSNLHASASIRLCPDPMCVWDACECRSSHGIKAADVFGVNFAGNRRVSLSGRQAGMLCIACVCIVVGEHSCSICAYAAHLVMLCRSGCAGVQAPYCLRACARSSGSSPRTAVACFSVPLVVVAAHLALHHCPACSQGL